MIDVNPETCSTTAWPPESVNGRRETIRNGARQSGARPLKSGAGGSLRDWVDRIRKDVGDPLAEANRPMTWLYRNCLREGRTDRLVNCLIRLENEAHGQLLIERAGMQREQAALIRENGLLRRMLADRDRQYAALQAELVALRRDWVLRFIRALRSDFRRIRRMFRAPASARAPG